MPTLIRRLPFIREKKTLVFPTGDIKVYRNQIILWLSLCEPDSGYDPKVPHPHFPALLDTGFGHNLHIHERHINHWAQTEVDALTEDGEEIKINGIAVKPRGANILLHRNIPGKVEPDLNAAPITIELNGGIAVQRTEPISPRIPLLGMLALRAARLHVCFDSYNGYASIRGPD